MLDSNQNIPHHFVSFQICTNDAEIVNAIVTLDNSNKIIEIKAYHTDEKLVTLTENDIELIRMYTNGMLRKTPM